MKRFMQATAVFLCLMTVNAARAQEAPPAPKPGPEHDQLKQFAGEWDALVKCKGLDGQPTESKGTYSAKMEVGGLFLVTEFKATLFGSPFHGRGFTGYDSSKKSFTGSWIDSMSPAIYSTKGAFDKAGKLFTEHMEGPGPDGSTMKFRMTTELKDKDHMSFKIYMGDGKEAMMETEYTRKK